MRSKVKEHNVAICEPDTITLKDLPALKKAFKIAKKNEKHEFSLIVQCGKIKLHTDYAKYLIDYMEKQ